MTGREAAAWLEDALKEIANMPYDHAVDLRTLAKLRLRQFTEIKVRDFMAHAARINEGKANGL